MARLRALGQGRVLTAKSLLIELTCDCGKSHIVEVAVGGIRINFDLMRSVGKAPIGMVNRDIPYRPKPVA